MSEKDTWSLGKTSARFESNGDPATVSKGFGDHGGASYGSYQLATGPGTLQKYIAASKYGSEFAGLKPGSETFDEKWRDVAARHADFGDDQHEFIKSTHYKPVADALAKDGLDVESRGSAVKDMVWSTSVQYPSAAGKISRGLRESYGDSYVASELTDEQIIRAVQQSKLRHVESDFASSMPKTRDGVELRIAAEEDALLALNSSGVPMTDREFARARADHAQVTSVSSSDRIENLQQKLADLDIRDDKGASIVPDGKFGSSTSEALHNFQQQHGIRATLGAGSLTSQMLEEGVALKKAEDAVIELGGVNPAARLPLDHRDHPDNALFTEARAKIAEVDRSLGREPDQFTANLASALVVEARSSGLSRIDQVALSTDGSKLWAVQMPPGRSDHLFDIRTSVATVEAMTPMEQSAAKWPQAMQQFEGYQQAASQSQQQALERQQQEAMGVPGRTR